MGKEEGKKKDYYGQNVYSTLVGQHSRERRRRLEVATQGHH